MSGMKEQHHYTPSANGIQENTEGAIEKWKEKEL